MEGNDDKKRIIPYLCTNKMKCYYVWNCRIFRQT